LNLKLLSELLDDNWFLDVIIILYSEPAINHSPQIPIVKPKIKVESMGIVIRR